VVLVRFFVLHFGQNNFYLIKTIHFYLIVVSKVKQKSAKVSPGLGLPAHKPIVTETRIQPVAQNTGPAASSAGEKPNFSGIFQTIKAPSGPGIVPMNTKTLLPPQLNLGPFSGVFQASKQDSR